MQAGIISGTHTEDFNAEQFVQDLFGGSYDGRILEALRNLTPEQLKQVTKIMTRREP